MSAENKLSPGWRSPYQEKPYFDACQKIGMDCKSLLIDGRHYYFYENEGEYIAWELSEKPAFGKGDIPEGYAAFYLNQIGEYEGFQWRNIGYATLFITKDDLSLPDQNMGLSTYTNRFRRSLKKAQSYSVKHAVAETDTQVEQALNMFAFHSERRNAMSYEVFSSAVTQYLDSNVADFHVVYIDSPEFQILGGGVVLKSPTQANLRFYSSQRTKHNAGHYLVHSMVGYHLAQEATKIVDLSGITPTVPGDQFWGINEFKVQITRRTAGFTKI